MRRKDREITDSGLIEEFISKEQTIRIAFYDNGDIYIVPVNYGYSLSENVYTFYFHGAKAGRKYELALSSPKVGFEIDGKYELITAESSCGHGAGYQSIIGTGTLSLVDDSEEKIFGLNRLMKQTTDKADWKYEGSVLDRVAVFKLTAEKMSCKARQNK